MPEKQIAITREDEEKFLEHNFAEKPCFEDPLSFDETIELIKNQTIPLELDDADCSVVLDESHILEIMQTLPKIIEIVNNPRSFIRTREEKVPVEIAKTINYKAISKLSRDCNDWYARTITSVKPKNIISDLRDETINIYENRFIVALLKKINNELNKAKRSYSLDKYNADKDSVTQYLYQEFTHSSSSFTFCEQIMKQKVVVSDTNLIDDRIDLIENAQKKIKTLMMTDFYRYLNKKQKVKDPIQRTNILMFEHNYNRAYKLWLSLNSNKKELTVNDEYIDKDHIENFYFLYAFISIISALYDMGFKETTGVKYEFDSDFNLKMNSTMNFIRNDVCIKLEIRSELIILSLLLDEKRKTYESFFFKPIGADIEKLSETDFEDYTKNELNKIADILDKKNKKSIFESGYLLVPTDLARYSENVKLNDRIVQRFYSIGNNFSDKENTKDLKRWGNYRVGMAIITPSDLKSNFLRIEKIINYHILKNKDFDKDLTVCPICGSKHIRKVDKNDYECFDCNHRISLTYCLHCDPNKKSPILWVKYNNDKFLDNDDIMNSLVNKEKYFSLSKIEYFMGEYATTSFELVNEDGRWKLKTICPTCGIKLGD